MNIYSLLFLQVPVPEDGKLWLWVILVLTGVVSFLGPLLWRTKVESYKASLASKDKMFEDMKTEKDRLLEELRRAKDEEILRLKKENEMLSNQNNQMMIDVISQTKFGTKAVEATNIMFERVINLLHEMRSNAK